MSISRHHSRIIQSLCISCSLFLYSCESQISDAFRTVNNSMERTGAVVNQKQDSIYADIRNLRAANEQTALFADTLFRQVKVTDACIDGLKEKLSAVKEGAPSPIKEMPQELELQLSRITTLLHTYRENDSLQLKLDTITGQISGIWKSTDWRITPTYSLITMLSASRMYYKEAAGLILADIRRKLTVSQSAHSR